MPFYEFECSKHGRFLVRQHMADMHTANCPECGKLAELRISTPSIRFAEPITFYQELPGGQGYQEIGWKADSGISPKRGQPYKTAKEVEKEG